MSLIGSLGFCPASDVRGRPTPHTPKARGIERNPSLEAICGAAQKSTVPTPRIDQLLESSIFWALFYTTGKTRQNLRETDAAAATMFQAIFGKKKTPDGELFHLLWELGVGVGPMVVHQSCTCMFLPESQGTAS